MPAVVSRSFSRPSLLRVPIRLRTRVNTLQPHLPRAPLRAPCYTSRVDPYAQPLHTPGRDRPPFRQSLRPFLLGRTFSPDIYGRQDRNCISHR
eukprot:4181339-Pleurochrysis_carterae.AAC.1